jgi:insertion element IS1 protein InsB
VFRLSPGYMNCNYCNGLCIKKGKYKTAQKYQCKDCKKYQRAVYCYRKYDSHIDQQVTLLNNEGVGISSISRVLGIPKTSVQRRINHASSKVIAPENNERGQEYEMDELLTFISRNHYSCYTYIIYAINRVTRKVVDYVIGKRTKDNIRKLTNKLLKLLPKRIYTDRLNIFESLIPVAIHRTYQYKTNRIERKNLTLRTHLKRLTRKTICYSKSEAMLNACVRLYMYSTAGSQMSTH